MNYIKVKLFTVNGIGPFVKARAAKVAGIESTKLDKLFVGEIIETDSIPVMTIKRTK